MEPGRCFFFCFFFFFFFFCFCYVGQPISFFRSVEVAPLAVLSENAGKSDGTSIFGGDSDRRFAPHGYSARVTLKPLVNCVFFFFFFFFFKIGWAFGGG